MTIKIYEGSDWNLACEGVARKNYFPLNKQTVKELLSEFAPIANLVNDLIDNPASVTYDQVKEAGLSIDGNDRLKSKLFNLIDNNMLGENTIARYLSKASSLYREKDLQGLKDLQQTLNSEPYLHGSAHHAITNIIGEYSILLGDTPPKGLLSGF